MSFTEGKIPVAVQGTRGAYSQLAAEKMFPDGSFLYFKNFGAVISAVDQKLCRFGVLPLENNTYGSVRAVYRLLQTREVSIAYAMRLKIDHVLLVKEGTALQDIRRVISHEQALGQCEAFLHSLGDKVSIDACLNTAVAARMTAESDDPALAAVSSPECAEIYGLKVLKRHIADNNSNFTRFICISGKEESGIPGKSEKPNRLSLILTIPHRPGMLSGILDLFAEKNINLLKIESVPIPGKDFEFMFFIDIEETENPETTRKILTELEEICPVVRCLGSYYEEY